MTDFSLTTGPDTINGTGADDTVNGTAATLNAGDRLTGGAGNDVLALYGSGTFHVDQLAIFTGFESITLNNFTNGPATLVLGSQSIVVTGVGSGSESIVVGSGATTFHTGSAFSNSVSSSSASNWNAGNVIDAASSQSTYLQLNTNGTANAVYDLTANTLTHLSYLYGSGGRHARRLFEAWAGGAFRSHSPASLRYR